MAGCRPCPGRAGQHARYNERFAMASVSLVTAPIRPRRRWGHERCPERGRPPDPDRDPDPTPMLEEPTPNPVPLEPALTDAERLLRQSLTEVCRTDPARADTGEMIRLEETLAIAGEAAKRAVSLRRRMRQEGRAVPRATKSGGRRRGATAEGPALGAAGAAGAPEGATAGRSRKGTGAPSAAKQPPADVAVPAAAGAGTSADLGAEATLVPQAASEHRTFIDVRGVTWSVWAVHPQHSGTHRAGLRGTYLQGWLTFVCEAEKRRLSPVPDGWMEADVVELERLCGTAEVAKADAATRRMPPVKTDD